MQVQLRWINWDIDDDNLVEVCVECSEAVQFKIKVPHKPSAKETVDAAQVWLHSFAEKLMESRITT